MIHASGYSVKANFRTFNLSPATKAYSQILLCNPGKITHRPHGEAKKKNDIRSIIRKIAKH